MFSARLEEPASTRTNSTTSMTSRDRLSKAYSLLKRAEIQRRSPSPEALALHASLMAGPPGQYSPPHPGGAVYSAIGVPQQVAGGTAGGGYTVGEILGTAPVRSQSPPQRSDTAVMDNYSSVPSPPPRPVPGMAQTTVTSTMEGGLAKQIQGAPPPPAHETTPQRTTIAGSSKVAGRTASPVASAGAATNAAPAAPTPSIRGTEILATKAAVTKSPGRHLSPNTSKAAPPGTFSDSIAVPTFEPEVLGGAQVHQQQQHQEDTHETQEAVQHLAEELTLLRRQHGQAVSEIHRLREATEAMQRERDTAGVSGGQQQEKRQKSPVGGKGPVMTKKQRRASPPSDQEGELPLHHHHGKAPRPRPSSQPVTRTGTPTSPSRTTSPILGRARSTEGRRTTKSPGSTDALSAAKSRKPGLPAEARGKGAYDQAELRKILDAINAHTEETSKTPPRKGKTIKDYPYSREILSQHRKRQQEHKKLEGSNSPRRAAPSPHKDSSRTPPTKGRNAKSPTRSSALLSGLAVAAKAKADEREKKEGFRAGYPLHTTETTSVPTPPSHLKQQKKSLRSPKGVDGGLTPDNLTKQRHHLQAEAAMAELSPMSSNEGEEDRTTGGGAGDQKPLDMDNADILQVLVELPQSPLWQIEACLTRMSTANPRDWIVLTSLLNHPSVITGMVVPHLLEELRKKNTLSKERGESILLALAGFGTLAAAATETLVDLLYTMRFDRKLVALALRCCGGVPALERLCDIVRTNPSPSIRSAAIYATCILPRPIQGRTTILVTPTKAPAGPSMSFVSVATTAGGTPGQRHPHQQEHDEDLWLLRLPEPPYETTHIIFDFDDAKALFKPFLHSAQYHPRTKYSSSAVVLVDLFSAVPIILRGLGETEEETETLMDALAFYRQDLSAALPPRPKTFLENDYPSLVVPHAKLRSLVLTTLMQQLVKDGETEIKKEIVAGLIHFPPLLSVALLDPLVAFAERLPSSEPVELHGAVLVLLGNMISVADKKDEELVHSVLRTFSWRLEAEVAGIRNAACIALGQAGALSVGHVDAIVTQLNVRKVSPAIACRALAKIGSVGVAVLLDLAATDPYQQQDFETRLAAVKALGLAPISPKNDQSIRLLETMAEVLCEVVTAEGELPQMEPLCVACIQSLGALLRPFCSAPVLNSTEEAIKVYQTEQKSPLVEALLPVIRHRGGEGALRDVAADILSRYGGAHGEVALIQLSMKDESPIVRATAVKALENRGMSALRPVALATADADEEVRKVALHVLTSFGTAKIINNLRARPLDHRNVFLKCCTEYLRFRGYHATIQQLHDILLNEVCG